MQLFGRRRIDFMSGDKEVIAAVEVEKLGLYTHHK
jgi:hypothetical protein